MSSVIRFFVMTKSEIKGGFEVEFSDESFLVTAPDGSVLGPMAYYIVNDEVRLYSETDVKWAQEFLSADESLELEQLLLNHIGDEIFCDCGGDIANSPHARWCSTSRMKSPSGMKSGMKRT